MDLSVELISATVQIEQPQADGTRTVGTGWLVSNPTPDGQPRTLLVTAAHVFERMPKTEARIGYRVRTDGVWKYDPKPVEIRSSEGTPRWYRHPSRDVAVLSLKVPDEFARAAIPLSWLATDSAFEKARLGPGEEMFALGYPEGLSANPAGFPILRSGRLASFPLWPLKDYPTFLMDFSVFPGNSGGPVFLDRKPRERGSKPSAFIAGILTQEVEIKGEPLGIGVVTHASFVREAIMALDNPVAVSPQTPVQDGAHTVEAAKASGQ